MNRVLSLLVCLLTYTTTYSQTNYAISFNGTNQWASIGTPIPDNSSYTKEAWVYINSAGGAQNIISSLNAPFWLNGGVLSAGQGGSYTAVTDATTISTGKWVYVAVTYDAATTTMKLYKDGIVVSTNTSVASNYTNEPVALASHHDGVSLLNGLIDEVRIWTIALSASQIKQNMFKGPAVNEAGLVAYYKCNDGAGSTLTDATGNTNGTLQNSPSWLASPVEGDKNGITFDGVDDNIVIPQPVTGNFTIEYWLKTTSTGASGGDQWYYGSGIVDGEVGGVTTDWGTTLHADKIAFGLGQPDFTIESTSSVNTGNWVHVAASWMQSTGEMKLYINGILENTGYGSTIARAAPPRLVMGTKQTGDHPYSGSLDEVRIWNEVRSLSQIQANMNKEIDPSSEPTLLAYYNFNQGITAGTNAGLTTLPDIKGNNNGTLNNFALTGTASNFTAQNSSVVLLPLQWLSFVVQKQNNTALLKWSTIREQNTKEFIVQHSSDGSKWNDIGVVAATGNYATTSDYSFTHTTPGSINYYRIQQVDIDNRSSYSDVRSLFFNSSFALFTVLNNPVANGRLSIVANKPLIISLFSIDGKLIWKKNVSAGNNTFDVSGYKKGIYLLSAGEESKSVMVQ
ncbi:MAG: T9SS type A sorting domain-containing protein [Chitinophagaceae bacterium]